MPVKELDEIAYYATNGSYKSVTFFKIVHVLHTSMNKEEQVKKSSWVRAISLIITHSIGTSSFQLP